MSQIFPISLLGADSRTADIISSIFDTTNYNRAASFVLDSEPGASGTITLDVKLQHSADLVAADLSQKVVGTTETVLRNGSNDNIKLAATWTQAGAGSVKNIWLRLKKNGTITSGKLLTLTIASDSSGPDTTLGTAGTVETDDIGTSYAWVLFTFATPVEVVDSTVYHVVLEGDYTESSSNNVTWRSLTVASGGNMWIFDSAWAATTTESFEIFGDQYEFSDVTDGDFAQVTDAAAVFEEVILPAGDLKEKIRAFADQGAGSTFVYSLMAIFRKKYSGV